MWAHGVYSVSAAAKPLFATSNIIIIVNVIVNGILILRQRGTC